MLRVCLLVLLFAVLAWTSEQDAGDRLTCALCIGVFGCYMLAENIAPMETIVLMLFSFCWGFVLQPAVLNRCHLTLWLLIFSAFRNLMTLESHATSAWRFATAADVYRVFAGSL